jgi:tRNA (cmo5U34)-methyltransferase
MTDKTNVWRSKELAEMYLDGVRAAVPMAGEQIDVLLRVALAARSSANCILDVGCGDGILGRALLDQYPEARAVFSDYSEHMLDAAKAKCPANRSVFILADYSAPSWVEAVQGRAPFDIVVSGFSIHHQPDERKRGVYREAFDLLTPGGLFLNLEHVKPFSRITSAAFDEMFIDNLCDGLGAGKARQEVADGYYARPNKDSNILAGVSDQCRWLRAIGFAEVDCYFKVLEIALFGGIKPL